MIQIVLDKLSLIKNTQVEKLLDIFYNKLPKVEQRHYSESVFLSEKNFDSYKQQLSLRIPALVNNNINKKPLSFVRGNVMSIFFAGKEQGTTFGFVLVHNNSKDPLLVVIVEKENTEIKYSSVIYDTTTKNFIESINVNKSCTEVDDLVAFVVSELNNDIDKFNNR